MLLVGAGSAAAEATNLLLANQSRLENPSITAAQYSPIGGAKLELHAQQPCEGKTSLRVSPGQAQPGSAYGASTTVGIRQRVYWYEKKEFDYETSQFAAGPYTVSMYVRGSGPVTLGFTADDGTSCSMECAVSATEWQRISLSVKIPATFHDATLSISGKVGNTTDAFFIDQLQWEQVTSATPFNAKLLPKERPPLDTGKFLWRDGDRVVCLGDSMTEWSPGYVMVLRQRVKEKYPDRNITIIGAGMGGNIYSSILHRATKDAIAREPDWVLINGGLNDVGHKVALDDTRKAVDYLVRVLLAATNAHVVVIETTPFLTRADLNPNITKVNAMTREVAQKYNLLVVPLEEDFVKANQAGAKLYFSDPHFNLTGFTMMADHILGVLHY
ncbi:MAG: SGNH/GDSL hydrolase family protein [Armatimonadota bacterium]